MSEIKRTTRRKEGDSVNHPTHYNAHPSGIECIDFVESFSFNFGNALKYLWRAGLKNTNATASEDIKKALFYLNRECNKRLHSWTQFSFEHKYYFSKYDTLFCHDVIRMASNIIDSDPTSALAWVLRAFVECRNPVDVLKSWIAEVADDKLQMDIAQ